MEFNETPINGAYLIELAPITDLRGFFARSYCRDEFQRHGLQTDWPQCNVSYNVKRGTLRGMHWQAAPHEEVKLVRCTAGAIYDVIIDLRPDSATFRAHFAAELSASSRTMFYIPKGCAHGFLTLVDHAEVFYQMGAAYVPEAARGLRWNDPAFAIRWPVPVAIVSDRDATYPDFQA